MDRFKQITCKLVVTQAFLFIDKLDRRSIFISIKTVLYILTYIVIIKIMFEKLQCTRAEPTLK